MAEGSNGRRRFSDKWGKHELDVLAVLSSAFPQWLTSRQIAQRVKAYADSYGELADQAAKAAFAKQFQRDRAKLAAMGIAIESRQPEYSSKSEGQDFASYRLQLGDEPRVRLLFGDVFSSRRRHTRFKCDWSSDVCSSDLSTSYAYWKF